MISTAKENITSKEKAILNALVYYDIFNHPLSFSELSRSPIMKQLNPEEIRESLEELLSKSMVFEKNGFYYIGKKAWSVDERLSEQKRVDFFMKKAKTSSRIIASFPFVRGVFISGALSKERVEKRGDIDFFIITEPGLLWVSRTLLVLFKKIFLLNSFKYFCLNYFIDTNSFDVPNKSLYTATDIVTLIPVYNPDLYAEYLNTNEWAFQYYPNHPKRKPPFVVKPYSALMKRFVELLLNNKAGYRLDTWLMERTLGYRRRKFNRIPEERFNKAFITRKNISTHHPNDFQDVIMERYYRRQKAFEEEHDIRLGEDKNEQQILRANLI